MTTFGPQLIGETEKSLGALLGRVLASSDLTEPQWVGLRLTAQLDGKADPETAIRERAHFSNAAELLSDLTARGLVSDGRLTNAGQELLVRTLDRIDHLTSPIWDGLDARGHRSHRTGAEPRQGANVDCSRGPVTSLRAPNGVCGSTAVGYEIVRDAFERSVTMPGNDEAQLAVYLEGRLVVDLWSGGGFTAESLTSVFSATKGAAHLVLALLTQEGAIHLDRQVVDYWPEFGANGKAELTVRDLVAHRAGLIGVDGGFTIEELASDRLLAKRLEDQAPYWTPGQSYGYHAYVIGALTGEVVRRATGRTIHEIYEDRIRRPHSIDFFLGLPQAEERRCVDVLPPLEPLPTVEKDSLMSIAFNLNGKSPTDLVAFGNTPEVRSSGPTSSGGVGSARGLAALYAAATGVLDGSPGFLSAETLREFATLQTPGIDTVTGDIDHFGLGFEIMHHRFPAVSPQAFGHSGATGTLALADPESGFAYGYVRRRFNSPYTPENAEQLAAIKQAMRSSAS